MGKRVDISGKTFGRVTVLAHAGANASRHATYTCACDCGTQWVASGKDLRAGKVTSCGCVGRRKISDRNWRHGYAHKTPEYGVWMNMKNRCLNPKTPAYKNYGARGITVCEEWVHDFGRFLSDMGPRPHPKLTIERVDNDRGYSPDNCVWDTRTTQARNKRNNRRVIRGDGIVFDSIAEAAEAVGGSDNNIISACAGRLKMSGGFTWRYADEIIK